jgi:HlyD family secretion protein
MSAASGGRGQRSLLTTLLALLPFLSACDAPPDNRMVGTLERDRIELTVESNEPIAEILVVDGEPAEAGQLLLQQDTARYAARLARAQADRKQAAARLAELQRGPRQEDIAQARSEVRAAEAIARNAKANLEREKELFGRGLSDAQARDLSQANSDDAQARLDASRQALERLLNGTTTQELDQAEAALEAMDAALQLAELDLERLSVRAPVTGIVDRVSFEVGERPSPGMTIMVMLNPLQSYARVYVPEPLKAQMTPGRTVQVKIDGVDTALEGTVRWVSADASFTPYFALTEHDRSRLAYLAEVALPGAAELPSGVPLEVQFP